MAGIALVVLVAGRGHHAGEPNTETPGCPNCDRLSDTQARQELADRYAPIVQLRDQRQECDKEGEGYAPLPVEIVLGNPNVILRKRDDRNFAKPAPTSADLLAAGSTGYLDLPGNPRHPGCTYERDGRSYGAGKPNVTYAHIVVDSSNAAVALQYWFFYYFNDANNKHEGDWEMIQIVFEAPTVKDALKQDPSRIAFSQHSGGELALWNARKVRKSGTHPIVFVAVGSQANYYGPHLYIGRAEQGAGFGCDDATNPGSRLQLEALLIPDRRSGVNDPYAWAYFTGRWGELAGPEFDGPTGPITKPQWSHPLAWEDDLRASSVSVPSRGTLGPNGVEAFCNIVASASGLLLPIYLQIGNISVVFVGIAALGLVVTLTKTRYIPIEAEPLRKRRRIGQILLSSLEIYRRHLRLFLGVGLVFIPIALLVSIVHWVVLSVSPIDSLVPIPAAKNIAQDLVWAFALSELQFGITYAIVVAATTAAIAGVESGRPVDVRGSYRALLGKSTELIVPRLLAIAAIVALGLTIVGLPLALRWGVRWTFIEQSVLLDGESGRRAPEASSRAVAADWWWCAAATISLAIIGLFAAPAIAIIVLLFARSVPLSYVDFLSSFIYVALVPYIAIALALVYFDLQARRPAAEPAKAIDSVQEGS